MSRRPVRVPGAAPGPVHWSEALAELHRWATPAMTAGDQVPVFGSPAWCALGDDDPAKTHAAARAALAWWTEQQATAEADADDHVQASHAIAAAHDWTRQARDHTRHTS